MVTLNGYDLKFWTFPGGERSVKIMRNPFSPVDIRAMTVKFRNSDDLIDMLLTCNALRNLEGADIKIQLEIPYFPFSRQDRVMTEGEPFGAQVAADIIKLCNFSKVTTWDAHSDVLAAMFPAGAYWNVPQHTLWASEMTLIASPSATTKLISPDAGAAKKIYKLAQYTGLQVIEANKIRDVATGAIVKTAIDMSQFEGVQRAIIVDDICDGGRTFTELAKVIRDGGYTGKLVLCVTHGIFSKGLTDDFNIIDEIYTLNQLSSFDLCEALATFNSRA